MSDFGAVYDYALALEAEIPPAVLASKFASIRPGFMPETKAMREAREKEEREAKTKEEREERDAAPKNGRPAATPTPAPRPAA
jgi:hypothetical protein